jgi:hypothetical protein
MMAGPTRISTLAELREAVSSRRGIVITDTANGVHFHPEPTACGHVREQWFEEKVLVNSAANGAYFSVASLAEARRQWPEVVDCSARR